MDRGFLQSWGFDFSNISIQIDDQSDVTHYTTNGCYYPTGMGMFTGFSGMFMLAVEFTAVRYRTYLNSVILNLWAVGYLIVDCAGYLIKQLVHNSTT